MGLMEHDLYSAEQVAELLNLHVKTVRNYVKEGRLRAVRIGKQYRIAGEDLAALTGRPVASFRPEPVRRERHIDVSSIVEIDAVSPETANRLINMPAESGMRVEVIYNRERAQLKIVLIGSMEQNASYFKFINAMLEAEK